MGVTILMGWNVQYNRMFSDNEQVDIMNRRKYLYDYSMNG